MKQRDPELGKGWVQIVPTLWLEAEGDLAKRQLSGNSGWFVKKSSRPAKEGYMACTTSNIRQQTISRISSEWLISNFLRR